jgi:hypothetical protein
LVVLILARVLIVGPLTQAETPKSDPPIAKGIVKELVHLQVPAKVCISFYAIALDSKSLVYCTSDYSAEGKPPRCELILVDLATGKKLRSRQTKDPLSGGVFSADGKLFAGDTPVSTTVATIWDVTRWEPTKVKLKRPDGYQFGWPLAFSPNGKQVIGRIPKKGEMVWDDLAIWDAATGACRILDVGATKVVYYGRSGVVIGKKDGKEGVELIAPSPGGPLVGLQPMAVSFPDHGKADQLFVEYHSGGVVTTLWDVKQSKPVRTDFVGMGWAGRNNFMQYYGLAGMGEPVPGSRADLCRFRATPSGRILQVPKYHRPPVIALLYRDGTISVVVRPT